MSTEHTTEDNKNATHKNTNDKDTHEVSKNNGQKENKTTARLQKPLSMTDEMKKIA